MISIHKNAVSAAPTARRSGRLIRLVRAIVGAVARRPRRRGPSTRDLHRLSEHLRRDIGISP